jgi:hypothetical protein
MESGNFYPLSLENLISCEDSFFRLPRFEAIIKHPALLAASLREVPGIPPENRFTSMVVLVAKNLNHAVVICHLNPIAS